MRIFIFIVVTFLLAQPTLAAHGGDDYEKILGYSKDKNEVYTIWRTHSESGAPPVVYKYELGSPEPHKKNLFFKVEWSKLNDEEIDRFGYEKVMQNYINERIGIVDHLISLNTKNALTEYTSEPDGFKIVDIYEAIIHYRKYVNHFSISIPYLETEATINFKSVIYDGATLESLHKVPGENFIIARIKYMVRTEEGGNSTTDAILFNQGEKEQNITI